VVLRERGEGLLSFGEGRGSLVEGGRFAGCESQRLTRRRNDGVRAGLGQSRCADRFERCTGEHQAICLDIPPIKRVAADRVDVSRCALQEQAGRAIAKLALYDRCSRAREVGGDERLDLDRDRVTGEVGKHHGPRVVPLG
jgi:hypothetical protein